MVNMNRRITIILPGVILNDQGGAEAVTLDSWEKWAHVENRTGSNSNPYQQQVWEYDYRITTRYEASRPTKSNYEVQYEGYRLKIESVSIDNEGFKAIEILRCTKVDEVVTNGQS